MKKTPPNRETLYRMYVEEGLFVEDIAQRTGYSRSRIFALMAAAGIERDKRRKKETPTESHTPPERPIPPTDHYHRIPGADWLRARYWDDNQNISDIAKELGVNMNSVTKALHRHGIPIKPKYLCYQGRHKGEKSEWSASLRRIIMQRDEYQCRLCEATEHLEVHHIIPRRLGGKLLVENGITLCDECHNRKIGHREVDWVGRLLELRGTYRPG